MPCRPAISSHSLGRAWVHDISKLDQAARYGLEGVEIFYEDLYLLADSYSGGPTQDNQRRAARAIRSRCDKLSLTIVGLQPFMHYEGLRDRQKHAERVEEFRFWIELAQILRINIILVPSTCLSSSEVSGDRDLIVQDMREIADIAAISNIRIAYESLAWGTHVDTWEQAWEIVNLVDRANFGICLDTFNIAARVYADPTAPSRRNSDCEDAIRRSMESLVRRIDVKKIMYVQVVDAEYLAEPLLEGHEFFNQEQHARMSWSRNCRLFYGEEDRGAYLPIKAILKTILRDVGYDGWISAELFSRSLVVPDPTVPESHASRAAESWQKIRHDFGSDASGEQAMPLSDLIEPRAQL